MTKPVAEAIDAIRTTLHEADIALNERERYGEDAHDNRADYDQMIAFYIERAFVETLVLLESEKLERTYAAVEKLHEEAQKDYKATEWYEADLWLVWAAKLNNYLDGIDMARGEPRLRTVTRDLIDILRATQYVITDKQCFNRTPAKEDDVHRRIEAVLKCVFPKDVVHKPRINKPIKNFEPDTGLASVRTLIEYKFIGSDHDAKRVADEILADTRAYTSRDWDQFVYVIYETYRVRSEAEWNELMRTSGVGENARVIVLAGEPSSDA
jgi:hypothetical protein